MIDASDPRLTAFALGELSDQERASLAADVASSPALAEQVAAIEALGKKLSLALAGEPRPTLDDARRATILQAVEPAPHEAQHTASAVAVQHKWQQLPAWRVAAAAAMVVAAAGMLLAVVWLQTSRRQDPVYRAATLVRVQNRTIGCHFGSQPEGSHDMPTVSAQASNENEHAVADNQDAHGPASRLHSRLPVKQADLAMLKAQYQAECESWEIEAKPFEKEIIGLRQKIEQFKQERSELVRKSETSEATLRLKTLDRECTSAEEALRRLEQRTAELEQAQKEKRLDVERMIASHQLEIDLLRERFVEQREVKQRKRDSAAELAFQRAEVDDEAKTIRLLENRIADLSMKSRGDVTITLLRKAELPHEPVADGFWARVFGGAKPSTPSPPNANSRFLESESDFIRSARVLGDALNNPRVAQHPLIRDEPNPFDWVSQRVRVEVLDAELMSIQCETPDPQFSVDLANAITSSYLQEQVEHEVYSERRIIELLEDERARRVILLRRMQDSLKKLEAGVFGKSDAASLEE